MSEQVLDTLRLTPPEVVLLLNELERDSDRKTHPDRQFRRWRMQYQRSVLTLLDHGDPRHLTVVPSNLSLEGVGLLLGTFVHVGTRCVMVLRCANGSVRMHPGEVVRCKLYKRHVHDIGVKFESRVKPEDYLIALSDDLRFNIEHVNVGTLSGSLVVVDPDEARAGEFARQFNGSSVVVKTARDVAGAMALLGESPHMMFVRETLPDGDAVRLVTRIRAEGHATPVVVLADKVTPELRIKAQEAGAHEVMEGGSEAELVHRAAAEFLPMRVMPAPVAGMEVEDEEPRKRQRGRKRAA